MEILSQSRICHWIALDPKNWKENPHVAIWREMGGLAGDLAGDLADHL